MERSGFIQVPPGIIGQGAVMPEAAGESGRSQRSVQPRVDGGAAGPHIDDWLRAELDDEYPLPPMPAPRPRLTPQPPVLPPPVPRFGEAVQATNAPLESQLASAGMQNPAPSDPPAGVQQPGAQQPERHDPRIPDEQPLPEWVIVLSDGVSLPIYGPVVIGRNPSQERFPDASVSAVADVTQTMSKTHARFWTDGDRLYVDDLNSTNGVALFPGGNAHGALAVEPGVPAELRSGDVVQLGEYRLSIRRS